MTDYVERLILMPGVHKTATTHLQHALEVKREALRDQDIGLILPKDHRHDYFKEAIVALQDPANYPAMRQKTESLLERTNNRQRTIIWHDENLIGGCIKVMLFDQSRIYPWGAQRLARIAAMFPNAKVTIALSVRAMGEFLDSAYAQSLRQAGYMPPENFFEGQDIGAFNWAEMIAAFQRQADCDIVFWRYEEYPDIMPSVFDHLLPACDLALDLDGPRKRQRLSQDVLDQVASLGEIGKTDDVVKLFKQGPAADEGQKASVVDPNVKLNLMMNYGADIAKAAQLDKVTFLTLEE